MNRVRIIDVARAAEVSRATVTNALNGTGRMSDSTRVRVRAVAMDLGYRTPARSLALAVTRHGGLTWDFTTVVYYEHIITAALRAAHRHGFGLTVLPSSYQAWEQLTADGVLILDAPQHDPVIERLAAAHTALTFIGRPDGGPHPSPWVDNDHRSSMNEILDHLRDQGGRRIALVAGDTTDYYTRSCVAAYHSWCERNRRPPRVEIPGPGWSPESLLSGSPRPDAVYAIYEPLGHHLLEAAVRVGLSVPRDLMVACFGEDPSYATSAPPVTTVSHRPALGGRIAVESLIALVESGTRVPPTTVPTTLTIRPSTLRHP